MNKKEIENKILDYLNDNFNADAYIVGEKCLGLLKPYFQNNKIIIEMSNKTDIELDTLEYIRILTNTSDITFHLEIRYQDCDKYGIITINGL